MNGYSIDRGMSLVTALSQGCNDSATAPSLGCDTDQNRQCCVCPKPHFKLNSPIIKVKICKFTNNSRIFWASELHRIYRLKFGECNSLSACNNAIMTLYSGILVSSWYRRCTQFSHLRPVRQNQKFVWQFILNLLVTQFHKTSYWPWLITNYQW